MPLMVFKRPKISLCVIVSVRLSSTVEEAHQTKLETLEMIRQ